MKFEVHPSQFLYTWETIIADKYENQYGRIVFFKDGKEIVSFPSTYVVREYRGTSGYWPESPFG